MSVTLRGTPVGDFAFGTSTTISKQAGLQVSDLLIWSAQNGPAGTNGGAAVTVTTPAGWTLLDSILVSNGADNRAIRHAVFWRIVDGTEGATFTASGTSTHPQQMASIMSAYIGANQTTPIDTYSKNGGSATGTTITATGITVTGSGGMLVGCNIDWETDRGPLTGMTEVLNSSANGLTCDNLASTPGATGNLTCACSSTELWTVFLISIAAAAGVAVSDPLEGATKRQIKTNPVYRMSPRSEREAQQFLRAQKRAYGFAVAA